MRTSFLLRIPRESGEFVLSSVESDNERKFIEFRRKRVGGVDAVVMIDASEIGAVIDVLKQARKELLHIP